MKRPWFFEMPALLLFALFVCMNIVYLHRIPGLLGDEGSEGQNVYELLTRDTITITGERSYIGPVIDYVRIPYISIFGYTALALRMLMFTANIATFILAGAVLRRVFGRGVGTIGLVACMFSPMFLLQQRIGWAIALIPMFAFLLLWIFLNDWKHKWIAAGLVAGLGLSNDIIFFPTLLAVLFCSGAIYLISPLVWGRVIELLKGSWLFIIGICAGFGTQFAVLLLQTEDQGSRSEVAAGLSERIHDFLPSLPTYLSGSSYVARYIGFEFSPQVGMGVTITLVILACIALFHKKRIAVLSIAIALALHAYVLLYMVDRYTLRYFLVFSIGVWLLAGLGMGTVVQKIVPKTITQYVPLFLAIVLSGWMAQSVFMPFLATGGSLKEFSLGNRNDKASALVDIRPLVECVRGKGVVYASTQDIYDRLLYLSHEYNDLLVVDGEHKASAVWQVLYRKSDGPLVRDYSSPCPDIPFFRVVKR